MKKNLVKKVLLSALLGATFMVGTDAGAFGGPVEGTS